MFDGLSAEKIERRDDGLINAAERSSEMLDMDSVERLFSSVEGDGAKGAYDFHTYDLDDGACVDVGRRAYSDSAEKREVPTDYCTEATTDANGLRSPSRLNAEKLTPEIKENIAGDPENDMKHWHLQDKPDTCAIASQEFAMEGLGGPDRQESTLEAEARDHGWMTDGGTPPDDVGKVAELHGFTSERQYGCTEDDMAQALSSEKKVIAGINMESLAYPELKRMFPDLAIFKKADHAVQVIGVDYNNPDDVKVILNDPGRPDGCGSVYSLSEFKDAWKTSDNFMATISR